jgi:hypothetical protein
MLVNKNLVNSTIFEIVFSRLKQEVFSDSRFNRLVIGAKTTIAKEPHMTLPDLWRKLFAWHKIENNVLLALFFHNHLDVPLDAYKNKKPIPSKTQPSG